MTYDEYIAQQQQAIDEEQSDDSCFLTEEDFIPDEIDLNVDDYHGDTSMLWDIDPGLAA